VITNSGFIFSLIYIFFYLEAEADELIVLGNDLARPCEEANRQVSNPNLAEEKNGMK
jgi:hypothetical protein